LQGRPGCWQRRQDRADRDRRAQAAQGIAHAQLIEYDGAPHGLFASHKDRLAMDVLAFLRG
jgi:hypothetical protein